MRKLTWEQWYEEIIELYRKPCVTYDGMVYICGKPPTGAKKELSEVSEEEVQQFRSNKVVVGMYREHYDAGMTPKDAFNAMW